MTTHENESRDEELRKLARALFATTATDNDDTEENR